MSITKYPPNTIWLGGPRTEIGDIPAKEIITPGMLVERTSDSNVHKWQKHSVAGGTGTAFATEQSMLNKTVDDTYAAGDLMEVTEGGHGTNWWAIIASGANIARGAKLESAGNGKLRAYTSGVQAFVALEAKDNSAGPGDARIRVEVA